MRWRCLAPTWNGRTLGISLLILSLVHTPLPQPDFHNIRHHDGQGEVCEQHDHLLRWHPGAGVARDVAVLHWHWFLPADPGTDPPAEGSGQAIHAHTPAWQAATWDDGPRVAPDTTSRLAMRPASCPLDSSLALPGLIVVGTAPAAGLHPPLAFSATFAPRVSLTSLLHRWVC
jgi:hypothetical protein